MKTELHIPSGVNFNQKFSVYSCDITGTLDLSGIPPLDLDEVKIYWFGERKTLNDIEEEMKAERKTAIQLESLEKQLDYDISNLDTI